MASKILLVEHKRSSSRDGESAETERSRAAEVSRRAGPGQGTATATVPAALAADLVGQHLGPAQKHADLLPHVDLAELMDDGVEVRPPKLRPLQSKQ